MLGLTGKLVNRAIARISALDGAVFTLHQFALLQAFESMSIHDADDQVLSALDRLESLARDEIKQRLGLILIKVQAIWGDHPIIREVMSRVLEVNYDDINSPDTLNTGETVAVLPQNHNTVAFTQGVQKSSILDELTQEPSDGLDMALVKMQEDDMDMPRLPPARFHYTEETKLNAIALLVSSNLPEAHALAKSAVERLGRVDLHLALEALLQMDGQSDEAVYRILGEFVNDRGDEYRIFAAWLLRKRFGPWPADYLAKLLCDPSTRVHRFALSLFDDRGIEEELILSVLNRLENREPIQNWHLTNLIRVLSHRNRFNSSLIESRQASAIVGCLMKLRTHSSAMVRLEVYKALAAWFEFIDSANLADALKAEEDPYLRAYALNFEQLCARID